MDTLVCRDLVIKPVLACNANCPTCASRRDLYRTLSRNPSLDSRAWFQILDEGVQLGVKAVTISGGEPTLFPGVDRLVERAKSLGAEVRLNTNGSIMSAEFATRLVEAGLDAVTVSLYAPFASLNDTMRRLPGLFDRALAAIETMVAVGGRINPAFQVNLQTLLTRSNFPFFDRLLRLAYDLGIRYLWFSYLEGQYGASDQRLTVQDIHNFTKTVIPRCYGVVEERAPSHLHRTRMLSLLDQMFRVGSVTPEEIGSGIYQSAFDVPCKRPCQFALVLANGDVHPCNVVEYTHEPIVGNVMNDSLTDIWLGEKWMEFRSSLPQFRWCRYCPVPLHFPFPIWGSTVW